MEGLRGIGGDEEEGAVVVGVHPGVFDGGAGLADAAHAVDGALAFDDDGAFGGEVLAEFGEEHIAVFEQAAEGGVGEVGGLPGEDSDFKLDGLDGLLQAARGIGGRAEVLMAERWVAKNGIHIFATHVFAITIGELPLKVAGQQALPIMQGRVRAGLDDRLDAPMTENLGDLLRAGFEPGGGAGGEDAGLSIHWETVAAKDLGQKTILLGGPTASQSCATLSIAPFSGPAPD